MSIATEISRINTASNTIAAKAVAMGLKDSAGVNLSTASKIDVVAAAIENVDVWTAGQPVNVLETNGFEEGESKYWMPKTAEAQGDLFLVHPMKGYNKSAHVEIPIKDITVEATGMEQTVYAYQYGGLIASVTIPAAETDSIDGKTYAEVEAALAAI